METLIYPLPPIGRASASLCLKPGVSKRPISITILALLYIAVGALATGAHYLEFRTHKPLIEFGWTVLGLAAVVTGIFMLSGRSWARWLAPVWITVPVAISVFHPLHELIVHIPSLVVVAYLLFRREARAYFRAA